MSLLLAVKENSLKCVVVYMFGYHPFLTSFLNSK